MLLNPLRHILLNSFRGLKQTWLHEKAFRREILACMCVLTFTFVYEAPHTDKLFVVFSLSLMLLVELLNTAIEKANDAFKQKPDPLIQFSKDAASAAVFITVVLVCVSLLNLVLA
jgi:diacylglycerol kinase (ATP)